MDRRAFASAAALGLLVPLGAQAQTPGKTHRIGVLTVQPIARSRPLEAFFEELRALGYVNGQNIVIDHRSAEGQLDRLPALATELVALKVDVIVAPSTVAARAARQATATIPIVSVTVPVPSDLATSLARPGGNVTGLAFFSPELAGKCLEQLKQAVPTASRVAASGSPKAGVTPPRGTCWHGSKPRRWRSASGFSLFRWAVRGSLTAPFRT